MTRSHPIRLAVITFAALALVAVGCSKKATPSSGGTTAAGGTTSGFSIAAPTDGASVSEPFTVKVDSSQPIGDPSTGNDHVHLCFDGADCSVDYKIMYTDSMQLTDLPPGQHTIEASLRNADHSPAGPTATITVTVTGGAASSSPSSSGSDGGGYYH
jgi:hypothetical protein